MEYIKGRYTTKLLRAGFVAAVQLISLTVTRLTLVYLGAFIYLFY